MCTEGAGMLRALLMNFKKRRRLFYDTNRYRLSLKFSRIIKIIWFKKSSKMYFGFSTFITCLYCKMSQDLIVIIVSNYCKNSLIYLTRVSHSLICGVGSLVSTEAEVTCSHRGVCFNCCYILTGFQIP